MKSFFGFWDSNNKIDEIQLTQIKLWANSILFLIKSQYISLYKTKYNFSGNLNIDGLKIIYINNLRNYL